MILFNKNCQSPCALDQNLEDSNLFPEPCIFFFLSLLIFMRTSTDLKNGNDDVTCKFPCAYCVAMTYYFVAK